MTEPIQPAAVPPPLSVEQDIPCRKCSYNLRGLPLSGQCPECGTAVSLSIGGNLIRYSDPKWVGGLSKGTRLILWGILIQFIAGFVIGVLGAMRTPMIKPLSLVVFFIAAVILFWGSWLLTEPDPSALGESEYGTPRRIVRVTLLIGIIVAVLNFGEQISALPPAAMLVLTGVGIVGGLANLIGNIAQLHYLQNLVLRILELTLSKRAGFLKYAIGWTYGLIVVIGAVIVLAARGAPRNASWLMPVGCAAMIVGLLLLVFVVMYIILLIRLNSSLNAQRLAAEQFWASRQPG